NTTELENRFYTQLKSGTAGMRGTMGIGTALFNEATAGIFAQAHANYLKKNPLSGREGIFIGYDSRRGSYDMKADGPGELSKMIAEIYSASGIPVYLSSHPIPTPVVAHTIVEIPLGEGALLPQSGGILTASHNPKEDNGYKIYEPDGHQVVNRDFIQSLQAEITEVSSFSLVKRAVIDWAGSNNHTEKNPSWGKFVPGNGAPVMIINTGEIIGRYVQKAKQVALSVVRPEKGDFTFQRPIIEALERHPVIITALKGCAASTVKRLLEEHGLSENRHFYFVPEERDPDNSLDVGEGKERGKPNPAYRSSFHRSLLYAEELKKKGITPRYIFASDPDSDRMGVVQLDSSDSRGPIYFTGNELLSLNAAYETSVVTEPEQALVIKSIVSSDQPVKIYRKKWPKVSIFHVLVGFKYFGQVMAHYNNRAINYQSARNRGFDRKEYAKLSLIERTSLLLESHSKVFRGGGEESMGQTYGNDTAEKDTPRAMARFAELSGWLETQNETMKTLLKAVHDEIGLHFEEIIVLEFPGAKGDALKKAALTRFRSKDTSPSNFGGLKVIAKYDYLKGTDSPAQCWDEENHLLFDSNLKKDCFSIPGYGIFVPTFYMDLGMGEGLVQDSADYLVFLLQNGSTIHIRPSGTEPVLKIYLNLVLSEKEIYGLPFIKKLLDSNDLMHHPEKGMIHESENGIKRSMAIRPLIEGDSQLMINSKVTASLQNEKTVFSDWTKISSAEKILFLKAAGIYYNEGLKELKKRTERIRTELNNDKE
ncbi:MAG: hypothetical protein JW774_10950, partial [Candidatus Aureabacteria bacterium]|nr:hypothetical protein [Candidatus Auribacterota bacterium]